MNEKGCTEQTVNIPPMSKPSTHAQEVDPVFAALGNTMRLALLVHLSDGEGRSIANLSANTRLTRQAITKHLHVLRDAGLVTSGRIGPESRFTYRPEPMAAARAYLDKLAGSAKRWPPPMPDRQAIALNRVFYALSSPTRRAMLRNLTRGDRNISELAAPFAIRLSVRPNT